MPGAKSIAMLLSGSAQPDIGDDGTPLVDDDLALLINGWWEPLTFALDWDGGSEFTIESDSYNRSGGGDWCTGGQVDVGPRSLVVLRRS